MSKRALRIFYGAMALLMVIPMVLGILGLPRSRQAATVDSAAAAEATRTAHLPIIQTDPSPTPPATPTQTPYSAAAVFQITPFKPMNASTFNTGSFVLENTSLGAERITQLRVDLSTAIFPKMVFDPEGQAGDFVAKDVVVDSRQGVGSPAHHFEAPNDGGYDVLVMDYQGFDPGDYLSFSVDVDPTSIKGSSAPGPGESGSVSGLELVGSTVTLTFDDGTVLTGQISRMPDSGNVAGAYVNLHDGIAPRPELEVVGVTTPAVVDSADQVILVSGPPLQPVTVMVVEAGLFTDGVPGGGHNLEPFDANNALTYREYKAYVGSMGTVEVPVKLSHSGTPGGINIISAVFDNHYGTKGLVSEPLVLELQ
ncbi:MAG: hypothetical protein R3C44_02015 [Chloroflexota bacterium]